MVSKVKYQEGMSLVGAGPHASIQIQSEFNGLNELIELEVYFIHNINWQ